VSECTTVDKFVSENDDEILTQYRESPNLLAILRVYLRHAARMTIDACQIIDHFDLSNDATVGDQLTIIGKALGWPRCHCAGQKRPVFGFECGDCSDVTPIGGFCEAEWDCGPEYIEFCFTDDDLYRGFLRARAVTLQSGYSRANLTRAARAVFGSAAVIYEERAGIVGIATGRRLSGIEISIAHLYEQVLPIPAGHRLEIWQSDGPPFGFGDGWGGFCDGFFPIKIPTQ
jgi:hypothetical protein